VRQVRERLKVLTGQEPGLPLAEPPTSALATMAAL
jgi:hypothetical protein